MEILTLEQAKRTKYNNLSVALGTFDGLHIGHMKLIEAVKSFKGLSAVLTFDSLPSDLFITDQKPMHLFTLEEKKEAFNKTGIDFLCVIPFDRKFAGLERNAFESLLMSCFSPTNIIAGYNYTYGKHAAGNVDTLKEFGSRHSCNIEIIPPVIFDGEPVSSSRIRECINAGSIEKANMLLGYNYSIPGIVERGYGVGSKLGFPTANVHIAREKAIPLRGVYGVDIIVKGITYKGVCNIGVRPTVSSLARESIEVHIISLNGDIYGEKVTVIFNKRIRGEIKFSSTEELSQQIKRDINSI